MALSHPRTSTCNFAPLRHRNLSTLSRSVADSLLSLCKTATTTPTTEQLMKSFIVRGQNNQPARISVVHDNLCSFVASLLHVTPSFGNLLPLVEESVVEVLEETTKDVLRKKCQRNSHKMNLKNPKF
eukprot:105432-Hanusia_phi.AAC.3